MPEEVKVQDADLVFALDIGTRSIIGVVGRVSGERLHVLAIEKEEQSYNNNEKILRLHKLGKSETAIAKDLGLGVGEVKLVIDLFKQAK